MKKNQKAFFNINLKVIVCLFVAASLLSGCEPLRKKFTRKKKRDKGESAKFIPVLEPIDYPERRESREDSYKFHYQLIKVWQKDFLTVLDESGSRKKLNYLLGEIIERLQDMQKMLLPEKQEELNSIITSFEMIKVDVNNSVAMQSTFSMESKVKRLRKKIRDNFSIEQVKDFIR